MTDKNILVPATPGLIPLQKTDPLRLSVSKAKTFLDCRKKFHFTYIQKLPRKSHDYLILGTMTHKVLEEFHSYYLAGCDEPYHIAMGRAFKAGVADHAHELTDKIKSDCKEMIIKYLKLVSLEKQNNMTPDIISVERRFEIPLGDKVVMNGAVDRYDMGKDGILEIIDYKSSKSSQYLKKDPFQLLVYAYVALQDDPSLQKVRGTYMMLKLDFERVTFEFTRDEIMTVEDTFLKYAKMIEDETEYKANPTALCSYCDHVNICPEGKAKAYGIVKYGETKWG